MICCLKARDTGRLGTNFSPSSKTVSVLVQRLTSLAQVVRQEKPIQTSFALLFCSGLQ
jgi:hypothetical protein